MTEPQVIYVLKRGWPPVLKMMDNPPPHYVETPSPQIVILDGERDPAPLLASGARVYVLEFFETGKLTFGG